MGVETFKRRKGLLLARYPYQIKVAFDGVSPTVVSYLGFPYGNPQIFERGADKKDIWIYTIVTRTQSGSNLFPKGLNAVNVKRD